ncbi:MAG TPA: transcriptional regulator [Terriglobales bacterium]|jgi:DNA-binding winged helix-turn-helix (wHTH) protein|nr:transcriptional regulator [Terriglobales bacterium]
MAEPNSTPRALRFGVFEADLRTGELRKNGMRIRLQEQPFQVLAALLERPGEMVAREELRQRLWPADTFVDFDHSLNTAINKLREALGDSAGSPRFIETLARRGYRFLAPVEVIGGSEAEEAPTPVPSATATRVPAGAAPLAEVAVPPRVLSRSLFALIQIMYLCFYVAALATLDDVFHTVGNVFPRWAWTLTMVALVTGLVGIAARLWLLSAVGFDYQGLGRKFSRLFPLLFPLDALWAFAPLLIVRYIPLGLAFACAAALLLAPFAQRTLTRLAYPAA